MKRSQRPGWASANIPDNEVPKFPVNPLEDGAQDAQRPVRYGQAVFPRGKLYNLTSLPLIRGAQKMGILAGAGVVAVLGLGSQKPGIPHQHPTLSTCKTSISHVSSAKLQFSHSPSGAKNF